MIGRQADGGGEPDQPPATNNRALRRTVQRVFGAISGLLIFLMMCVTVADVIGRYGFNQPLPGASEITEVMLGTVIFAALPLVMLENGHITTTLFTDRLTPQGRHLQAALVTLFSALILSVIAWRLYRHGLQLASYGEVTVFLGLPKGPLAYLMASLAALGALIAAALALRLLFDRYAAGRPAPSAGQL
jgi:TRAP-type C4-dicarboxylate transport system permease small subunit